MTLFRSKNQRVADAVALAEANEWRIGELDDIPVDCIRCQVIHEANVPCGAPFCRLRSAWRRRRS